MSAYGRLSQWRDTEALTESKARELADRLELRGRAEDEISARDEYLRLLELSAADRVLEIGCGSGVVTRAIAQRIAPGGAVVGVDSSPALLGIAREVAQKAGLAVEFQTADCRALPFDDRSFDVALAATTLAHVPVAEKALAEMVRVVRPGGRVAVFDFDGDSLLISHPDRGLTRRIVQAFSDNGAVNSWLARSLPGLLRELGISNLRSRAFMPLEAGGYYAKLAETAAAIALNAGAITEAERERWIQILRAEIAAARFIGGRLHIFVWGVRPQN
jgi:ubiquinone/menaquinone biosynthesis C-methylase UbiE